MNCWNCRYDLKGVCDLDVNKDLYGDNEACPFYRSVERLALWASRHELDQAALAAMRPHDRLVKREILWPEDQEDCIAYVENLVDEYDLVYGVFPSQALEAVMLFHWSPSDQCYYQGDCKFFSAVSRPVKEPDTDKTRGFEFVRWARLI
jgi:hypothetical protein